MVEVLQSTEPLSTFSQYHQGTPRNCKDWIVLNKISYAMI